VTTDCLTFHSIWTAKFTVSEFLKRLTGQFWRKEFEWGLRGIRIFLAVTFLAVFIATLAECQPFSHYWQVVPDPGPRCRQGYAQLITMGTCDIITDLLLVVFPIPIIVTSAMPTKRKVSLTLLFSLSLALVGITAYRVPAVIERRGSQQFRSLIASFEILAATAVSNAVVIGSFIRDRGVKKQKYRHNSVTSSLERTPTRRTTITQHHWGSDADLVGDIGMRLDPDLQSRVASTPRAPPMAQTASVSRIGTRDIPDIPEIPKDWTLASGARQDHDRDSLETDSTGAPDQKGDIKKSTSAPAALDLENGEPPPPPPQHTLGKMSFFDVGGLMESSTPPPTSSRQSSSPATTIHAQDFAIQTPSAQTSRRGSRALLSDVGGLLSSHVEEPSQRRTPHSSRTSQQPPPMVRNFSRGGTAYNGRSAGRRSNADENNSPTPPYRAEPDVTGPTQTGSELMSFVDVGGLLGGNT
jgi:hypothetical protein